MEPPPQTRQRHARGGGPPVPVSLDGQDRRLSPARPGFDSRTGNFCVANTYACVRSRSNCWVVSRDLVKSRNPRLRSPLFLPLEPESSQCPSLNDRDSARPQGDQEAKEKLKIEAFEKSRSFGFESSSTLLGISGFDSLNFFPCLRFALIAFDLNRLVFY